jgi:hypothetical protein
VDRSVDIGCRSICERSIWIDLWMSGVECGMLNAECGMLNAECGMWNMECFLSFRYAHALAEQGKEAPLNALTSAMLEIDRGRSVY